MRFLHTSDWHLGVALGNTSMIAEQREFVAQILAIADENKVDAVLIAGDVFDHAVSAPDAINLYNEAMTALCVEQGIPVVICAGNHDGAARLSSCSELLKKAGLYVAGSIKNGVPSISFEDATVHILPFFSIEEARYLYPDAEIKNYDMAMKEVLRHITMGKGKNILAAHCFVSGAEVSESDRSAMIGGANRIGADAFEGFDYVALGHLHRAQDIGSNIRYAGSPMKLSFSEAGNEKTVTIVDTDSLTRETIPLHMKNDLRVVRGEYEQVLDFAMEDPAKEDYIKIELSDEYAHMEVLNTFRNYYPNLLSLVGKSFEADAGAPTLSVDQTASLNPEEIMMRFFEEYAGEQPTQRQLGWFRRAMSAVEKEGEAQ